MATTPYVDPWTVQPDQSVGEPVSEALISAISDNLNTLAHPPEVGVHRSATQTISTSTSTPVEFTAADLWDTDNIHDTNSNPSKLVIPAGMGGIWAVATAVTMASGTTGWTMLLEIYVNGASRVRLDRKASSTAPTMTVSGAIDLAVSAGDEIEIVVWQDSGSGKNAAPATATARLVSWL